MYLDSRDGTTNATVLPAPYPFTPSGSWDGNDGKWSTFMINTGDTKATGDGQNFRVLISILSSVTQVPVQAPWCGDAECAKKRGIEPHDAQQPLGAKVDSSTGWNEQGLFKLPLPEYWSGPKNLSGDLGTMPVGLGETSTTSPVQLKQLVVQNSNEDLFMGTFGLGYNSISTGDSQQKPWLTNLNESGTVIPSASYGYAAGASYKNGGKGLLGSLILGGYDLSRFQNTSRIDIDFPNSRNTSLVVAVQDIIYHPDRNVDANDYSLTPTSNDHFNAVIDSELPYLEMPKTICDAFADKFQLTYDEDRNLYTVDASAHNYNKQQKATVNFKIGKDLDSTNTYTTIQLPYDAFDLEGSAPLFPNTTQYFPLRRATTGQNVLGRAFLQEAYIIVDYENWRFTVAPATFSDPLPSPDIQTIYWKGYQPPGNTTTPNGGGSGLSGGAIAGIVVGIVVVLGLLGAGLFFFWKRRRQQQRKLDEKASETDIDTVQAGEQVRHRRISELDSEAGSSIKTAIGGYYNRKDGSPFPPISEMESPPAELYSPPPESLTALSTETPQSDRNDYFVVGNKVRRRGATRESSGQNTPGTPAAAIAELPGDDGKFTVDGQHFEPVASPVISPLASPVHSRGGSEASQASGIDEIVAGAPKDTRERSEERRSQSRPRDSSSKIDEVMARHRDEAKQKLERAPSHSRGQSDATVASESTAVSQPTPEELETWAMGTDEPRRPLSE